ncbi:polyprenyl diphosphate synthase [Streptomyces halobius]|uniref:Di-trans,poly-cis-decaprenylcistransferase n=1 Tax=Streptomyces halobius TaxID=2879846 RepID=A0ABY4M3H3_9ACTN|nr:polyprenyl diphosphate synthase [Streptomyces halobius]UQA91409.1 di-trans,poly-cis-decaprenylcistransferase [Streptomyces halobius]
MPAPPRHVAIIMDGNGRWATSRGLPRTAGHTVGERALADVVEGATEIGIRYLTVFAFSTENWNRPPAEVRFLMTFIRRMLRPRRDALHAQGVRIRWLGRISELPPELVTEIEAAERLTAGNTGLTLAVCINYGGRSELVDAARRIAEAAAARSLDWTCRADRRSCP